MGIRNRGAMGRQDAGKALLLEHAALEPGERMLDLGHGGDPLALNFADQAGIVSFVSPDIRAVRTCQREIDRQGTKSINAILDETLQEVPGRPFDVAVYEPVKWVAKGWVFKQIDETFQMLRVGGRFCISGRKDRGVESYKGRLETVFGNVDLVYKKGGNRCYRALKKNDLPGAEPVETCFTMEITDLPGGPYRLETRAGVFSRHGLDEGTRFLIETMKVGEADRVLDLGCGVGAIGLVAARLAHNGMAILLDADLRAVKCANRNLELNAVGNATVALSDAFEAVSEQTFDLILSNPPSHEGSTTGQAFVYGASRHLASDGQFLLVSTRGNPYRLQMVKQFECVEEIGTRGPYSVLRAGLPKRA